jgi:hypothetical protein
MAEKIVLHIIYRIKMNKKRYNIDNYKHDTCNWIKKKTSVNRKVTNIKSRKKLEKTYRPAQNNFIKDKKRK